MIGNILREDYDPWAGTGDSARDVNSRRESLSPKRWVRLGAGWHQVPLAGASRSGDSPRAGIDPRWKTTASTMLCRIALFAGVIMRVMRMCPMTQSCHNPLDRVGLKIVLDHLQDRSPVGINQHMDILIVTGSAVPPWLPRLCQERYSFKFLLVQNPRVIHFGSNGRWET